MNPLQEDLEDHLHAAADRLELPPGDLGVVMARGRARGRRRALTSMVAVALVAGTIATATLYKRGSRGQSISALGAASGPVAAKVGDVGVAWQQVDPHSALAYATITGGATPGSNLYAVSTAPGVHDPNQPLPIVLYRSADGVNWTQASSPSATYLSELSASGSQLYAVGTGPATAGKEIPLSVATSPDGGATWKNLSVPIDMGAIDTSSAGAPVSAIQVVSNGTGAVVVAQVSDSLDVTKYLPAGVTAPNGWVFTATGVDLLGPQTANPCPTNMTLFDTPTSVTGGAGLVQPTQCVDTSSLARTQAAAAAAKAALAGSGAATGQPLPAAGGTTLTKPAFKSVDPLDDHPVTSTYTWAQLGVSGTVLQAALGQPFVFFTSNGSPLQPVSLPDMVANPQGIQLAAGPTQFAFAAQTTSASGQPASEDFWTSSNGTAWTEAPVAPADQASPSAIGYLNGALTTISSSAPVPGTQAGGTPTVATLSPTGWSEVSLASVLGPTDGKTVSSTEAAIGPFGIVATEVEFPGTNSSPTGPTVQELLTSRDGITWSSQNLDQVAGVPVATVANVAVTANTFVLTVQAARTSSDVNAPAPERVLVGAAR
ncbi:MAG: hypothetical protein ACRDZ8_07255 [Acidimicrobiales bacterium]